MTPKRIHLSDIANPELDEQEVETEVVIAGIGDAFGVPKEVEMTCMSGSEKHECRLGPEGVKKLNLKPGSRRLLNCYGVPDDRLASALNKPDCAHLEIMSRYTMRTFLALPTVHRLTMNCADPFMVTDDTGREYRGETIYYIEDKDPSADGGFVPLASVPYRAIGVVQTEPKRQKKVLQVTRLEPITPPWQKFELTTEAEQAFDAFQAPQGAVEFKIEELVEDATYHITRRYGKHRELILTVELIVASTPISLELEGERKPGYGQMLVVGDTGEAKTTTVENFLNAVGLGVLAEGSAATRTGLTYSLDDRVDDRRVLRWGLFPQNNGGLVVVDEAHKLSWADWSELTSVRSTGEVRVDKSVRGRHPAEVRQIYLANPPQSQPLAGYYCGIEALRGLMRLEDLRRFDLVILAARGDNEKKEYLARESDRQKSPQLISPELWRAHLCWAWSLKPGSVRWSEAALDALVEVARELDERYGGATDMPLVGSDIKDKVARLSQGVAALVHSTEDHKAVDVLVEHVQYVGSLVRASYDHENCRLDEYAKSYQSETKLDEAGYLTIKAEIDQMKAKALSPDSVDEMLTYFRQNELLSVNDLAGLLGMSTSSIRIRVAVLKKHGLLRSGRSGYRRTPKFIAFLRKISDDH